MSAAPGPRPGGHPEPPAPLDRGVLPPGPPVPAAGASGRSFPVITAVNYGVIKSRGVFDGFISRVPSARLELRFPASPDGLDPRRGREFQPQSPPRSPNNDPIPASQGLRVLPVPVPAAALAASSWFSLLLSHFTFLHLLFLLLFLLLHLFPPSPPSPFPLPPSPF